jgi:histidine triad (HIT) family protein
MGNAPAQVVADTGEALAFTVLDAAALAPGHVLVIPRRHCVLRALPANGVNLLSAFGPGSDQSVDHWHMHVVPRRAGDGIETWPESGSMATGQFVAAKLLEAELNKTTASGDR